MVNRFPANANGRDFVVGDMHGCRAEFADLLRQVDFDEVRDRVFSVGDLVDRGPDSFGCLDLLYEQWFHAVIGNHEQMMLDAYTGRSDGDLWRYNGGGWAVGLSADQRGAMSDLCALVDALPIVIVVGEGAARFNVVHAEFAGTDADIDAGVFSAARRLCCIWARDVIKGDSDFTGEGLSPTYCGHTIVRSITRTAHHVFIDTGAFIAHGNYETPIDAKLTMIEPRTGATWEARKARKAPGEAA